MSAIAAIDCGTNSLRLLVLQRTGQAVQELERRVRLARLGQGVDATGRFHPEALERVFVICEEFADLLAKHKVTRTRFVATSAARDVSNRELLIEGVRQRLGVEVEVISGQEEARLTAEGVLSGIDAPAPVVVVDIGGGSTELVSIDTDRRLQHSISLDVGAVRVTERFLRSDPPTSAQQTRAREFIDSLLDGSGVEFSRIETCVGLAGTVTTLVASVLGLESYSRQAVHQAVINRRQISEATAAWLGKPIAEIEAEPLMQPLRAGVIAGGAMILEQIAKRIPSGNVMVSETDILDGIALGLLS